MNPDRRFLSPRWGALSLILFSGSSQAGEVIDAAPLKRWVQSQQSIQSIVCAFTQERKLRAFRKPLVTSGKFWYRAPDHFRWQLGDPPRNIALHTGEQLTLLDLKKKRAMVVDLNNEAERSRYGAYFELAFPRTWESFRQTFNLVSLKTEGNTLRAELSPRTPQIMKGAKTVHFLIDTRTQHLLQFAIELRDGSAITTTFNDVKSNVEIASGTFTESLEDFRVKETN